MDETYKDESRIDFRRSPTRGRGHDMNIQLGCLQRIADAVEKMASSYDAMREDRDRYKRWYEDEQAATGRLCRSNAALRGHIKRLKGGR